MVLFLFTILLFTLDIIASNFSERDSSFLNDSINSDSEFQLFLEEHSFKTIYLVFAGPYPSSPTSSFGHIFALTEPTEKRPFLMWDAIDFSADLSEYSTISFFYNGLFGSLNGYYKIIPFYEKLREYTFIESRSLWLFPIQMDEDEKYSFLFQLYNIRDKVMPYRFPNRNCASEIFRLINNSSKNPKDLNNFLVLPYNVINKFESDSGIFIESVKSSLQKYNSSKAEKDSNIISNSIIESQMMKNKLSLMEWIYFNKEYLLSDSELNELKQLRKEVLDTKSDNFSSLHKFHKSFSMHPSMQTCAGFQYNTINQSVSIVGYRFGLHDFFDNFYVYPKHDYLTLLSVELGITDNDIFLNKLMIFDQLTLQPISFLSMSPSWNIGLGTNHRKELDKRQMATGLFFGYGYTIPILSDEITFSLLINANPVYLSNSVSSILTGSEIIFRCYITDELKYRSVFRGTIKDMFNIHPYYCLENSLGFNISNHFALMLNNSLSKYNNEYSLNIFFNW